MVLALLLAPARVEIDHPAPPGFSGGLVVGLALLAFVAWLLARRNARRPGGERRGFSTAVGSALSEFAAPLQPQRPTVMEIERAREPTPPEEVGDGRDPTGPRGSINAPPRL